MKYVILKTCIYSLIIVSAVPAVCSEVNIWPILLPPPAVITVNTHCDTTATRNPFFLKVKP